MKKEHNQHTLKEVLEAMIKQYKLKDGLQEARIKNYWKDHMGESINRYTANIEIRKRKLYLNIISAPLKQELTMGKEKIRQLLNEQLGEDYILEVIIL